MPILGEQWPASDPLEAVENLMLEHVASGEPFDGPATFSSQDGSAALTDPEPAAIRAAVLRHLLTENEWRVNPKGVRLCRVRIAGPLDLEGVTLRCPLVLEDCDLVHPDPVSVDGATMLSMTLNRCRLAGLSGDSVTISGNLNLTGSVFSGPVVLSGARIGGAVLCTGAHLGTNEYGEALICNGMNVRLSVHLRDGFISDGAVSMPRADIGGDIICRGAHLGANDLQTSLYAPGVKIGGGVYFSDDFMAAGALHLAGANIGGQVRCDGASVGADTDGNSLFCDGMRVGGSVNLDATSGGPFTSAGAVRLAGAEISGSLTCRGASLGANPYGNALVADEMQVAVAVLLEDGFTASGAVRLAGAGIGGQFSCDGGRLIGADQSGYSLVGDGIKVGGPAHMERGFESAGGVVLSGADIGGVLSLTEARLGASTAKQQALAADGIKVGRNLVLDGAICAGVVWLAGAVVDGSLTCVAARLDADQAKNSLDAGRLTVSGDVTIDRATTAGAIIVVRASIGGVLSCRGTRLGSNVYQNALNGNSIRVGRGVLLTTTDDGLAFAATGAVRLAGADINGSLHCQGARLERGDLEGDALVADGVVIGGSVHLDDKFISTGTVRLPHASIRGSLHLSGASLGTGEGRNSLLAEQANVTGSIFLDEGFAAAGAVSLSGASVGHELRWEPGEPPGGQVNLEGASAEYLVDDWTRPRAIGYWPPGRVRLAGFTYSGFGGDHQATVEQRLDWLRNQHQVSPGESASPFATQPYRQLADVYRRAGQEDDAIIVEIAMRRDMRRNGNLPLHSKVLNWILEVTIRYGFHTGRALVGIIALYMVTFLAFLFAQHQANLIVASNINNPGLHPSALQCVSGYPCFYPAGYAFDLVVPLINIHEADYWQANGHHWFGWAWVLGSWVATALGWFLATLLVVGYTGLARRE